jgi:hypothetical protein
MKNKFSLILVLILNIILLYFIYLINTKLDNIQSYLQMSDIEVQNLEYNK